MDVDAARIGADKGDPVVDLVVGAGRGDRGLSRCRRQDHHGFVIRAADADGGGFGSYQIILLVLAPDDARDGAETAAQQRNDGVFRSIFLAAVAVGVETHVGVGADCDESAIHHFDLRRGAGRRDYPVAFIDLRAFLQCSCHTGRGNQLYIADHELHIAGHAERGAGIGGEQQQNGKGP